MTNKKHIRNLKRVVSKTFRPFEGVGEGLVDVLQDRQEPFDFSYLELEVGSWDEEYWGGGEYKIVSNFTIVPKKRSVSGYTERDLSHIYDFNEKQFRNIPFEQVPYLLAYLRLDPDRFLAEVPYGIEKTEFVQLLTKFDKRFIPSCDRDVIATTPVIRNGKKVDNEQMQFVNEKSSSDGIRRYFSNLGTGVQFFPNLCFGHAISHGRYNLSNAMDQNYIFDRSRTVQEALDKTIMLREINKQLRDF